MEVNHRHTRTAISRQVRQLLGKAIAGYRLIEPGDRIAVAVSGGKDSLVLLWLLRERLARIPIDYELTAIHVDLGFDPGPAARLKGFLEREGFSHRIVFTRHGLRAHSEENRENPCFLCSRLRRTTLFQTAADLGCNKIALGHNQDDFIETLFINILYAGQVAAIVPRQPFFAGRLTVIRPLALFPSDLVQRLADRLQLPVVENPCPSRNRNQRALLRELLSELYASNDKVRGNIFHAMTRVNSEYLPPPLKSPRRQRRKRGSGAKQRTSFPDGVRE